MVMTAMMMMMIMTMMMMIMTVKVCDSIIVIYYYKYDMKFTQINYLISISSSHSMQSEFISFYT